MHCQSSDKQYHHCSNIDNSHFKIHNASYLRAIANLSAQVKPAPIKKQTVPICCKQPFVDLNKLVFCMQPLGVKIYISF